MVTVIEKAGVFAGLDFAVVAEHGGTLAWCHDKRVADLIADALNNFWRDGDRNALCSGCCTE